MVALAALLALVAVASAARLGSGEAGGGRLSLPDGAFAWLYALFLVGGALTFPLLLYVSMGSASPADRQARRRRWLAPLWLAGVLGAFLVVRIVAGERFGNALDRLSIGPDSSDLPAGPRGGLPPAPEAAPLVAVVALSLAGAGTFFAHRALRRRRSLSDRVGDHLSSLVEESLDDLRDEPDVRRAIVRAYARMERVLERSGLPREHAEAPLEYLGRVLLALDVRPAPVQALTELFERAKFSAHALGADAKEAAIAALEGVRDDLERADEPETASA